MDMKAAGAAEAVNSQRLYERAKKIMAGGVSRNTVMRKPHPLYVAHAEGCRITDVDGIERIDFANNMTSLIHGHAHPAVTEAVTEQLRRGSAYTLATEIELDYAEQLCARNPTFEQVRFVNSGTEAVMGALKAARAFTGRPKIAKVEGTYTACMTSQRSARPQRRATGEASTDRHQCRWLTQPRSQCSTMLSLCRSMIPNGLAGSLTVTDHRSPASFLT